jgi:C4-dicarboxylate-specific signal transduction histidine kinase
MVLERAEYETLSGSKIQCREIVFPIISDNECIMVAGIIQDLTEEVQLLEVLEQQKNQLKSQSKLSSLGQVSASLVHEINNPISVIMGFASQAKKMLEKGIGSNSIPLEEDSEKIINKIEKIESMAWRIGKIISGLKKLSRDGQNDPIEFFSLSEVIEESLSLTRESFRFHSIRLEVSEVEASLNISGRVVEVSQILVNLLVNASDAIEGLDSPWVRLSFCESLDADYIYIEDSGPGIPENIVDQVMRPFFTTKAVGKGTGLGLSISKKIMESHGGELIYDSQAPNTCFILKFPKLNSGIKSEAA